MRGLIAVLTVVAGALTPIHHAATASGAQTSAPPASQVVNRLATGGAFVSSFEIVADRKAGWHAAWVQAGEDKKADIYYARVRSDGKFGASIRVTPSSDLTWGDAINPPDVGVLADGAVVIAWRTKSSKPEGPSEVMLSRLANGGPAFSPPVKVSDGPPAYRDFESMAVTSEGHVAVVWIDDTGVTEDAQKIEAYGLRGALSSDGGRSFAAPKAIASMVCGCCATDIAALNDGGFLATWRGVQGTSRDPMEGVIPSGLGIARASKLPVTTSWKISGCPHTAMGLSTSASSRLAWYYNGAAKPPIWEFATGTRIDAPAVKGLLPSGMADEKGDALSDLRLAYDHENRLEILWKRDLPGAESHELFVGRTGGPAPGNDSMAGTVSLVRSTEAVVAPAVVPAMGKLTLAAWLTGPRGNRALDYRVLTLP